MTKSYIFFEKIMFIKTLIYFKNSNNRYKPYDNIKNKKRTSSFIEKSNSHRCYSDCLKTKTLSQLHDRLSQATTPSMPAVDERERPRSTNIIIILFRRGLILGGCLFRMLKRKMCAFIGRLFYF